MSRRDYSISSMQADWFLRRANNHKWLLGIVLSMLFISVMEVNGQQDLSGLIQYSLDHSREVKKAALQTEEARYMRKEAVGQGLPQIEASGTYSKMMFDKISLPASLYDMIPADYAPLLDQISNINALYTASAGVQVTQLLYSQAYLEGLKATKKTQELYDILRTKTEEEVIEEVATCYYQVLSLGLQLQTVDKSLKNLKELSRIVTLNYQNDLVKESNVDRLKVTVTNLEVTRTTIQNGMDIQINYIKALAGMPADTLIFPDTVALNRKIQLMEAHPVFSVDQVPSFQTLLKQDELYRMQIRVAQSKYYPTLAAFGKFNYSSYNTTSDINKMTNMNTIGLQLQVPIFTSGVIHARVNQARMKESQLQEDIMRTRDLLTISYRNAWSEYQTAGSLLEVQKQNQALALKVFNQTSLQYQEGMASMADVLNVNSDFLQAENSYNQQLLKCKLAEIKLLKSTGSLHQLVSKKQ